MSSEMIGALGLGLLLVLMVLRVPVALCMLIVGVGGFAQVISWSAAMSMVKSVPVEVLSNYSFRNLWALPNWQQAYLRSNAYHRSIQRL